MKKRDVHNAIIGYDVEGNPRIASEMKVIYDEEVEAAVKDGKYVTLEDLKNKSAVWLTASVTHKD